jgi:proteasome assembly chaperone (PAC2) family protein
MHEALKLSEELRPLRDPVFIAAFRGWNDGTASAPATIRYLTRQWDARQVAEIDPEPFFDFTVQRPRSRVTEGQRTIEWPANRFYIARAPGVERDFLLLHGREPALKWRTFTTLITDVMAAVGATTGITLDVRPSSVPHTRPSPVSLSVSHPELEEMFGLKAPPSRYQGPVGIGSVLNLRERDLKLRNAGLIALAPHYLTNGPNPNVEIALIQALDRALHTSTPVERLEERAQNFARQVEQAMDRSAEARDYVRQLEEQYDSNQPAQLGASEQMPQPAEELPSSQELISDLEQFLKQRREDED